MNLRFTALIGAATVVLISVIMLRGNNDDFSERGPRAKLASDAESPQQLVDVPQPTLDREVVPPDRATPESARLSNAPPSESGTRTSKIDVVAVRVIDPEGDPIHGIGVKVCRGVGSLEFRRALTDAHGMAYLELEEGERALSVVLPEDTREPIEYDFPTKSISLRTDANPHSPQTIEALSVGRVELRLPPGLHDDEAAFVFRNEARDIVRPVRNRSGGDRRVEVLAEGLVSYRLAPGAYSVVCIVDEHSEYGSTGEFPLTIVSGETTSLEAPVARFGGVAVGVVRTHTGSPVARSMFGIKVVLGSGALCEKHFSTDESGRFHIFGIPSGEAEIVVEQIFRRQSALEFLIPGTLLGRFVITGSILDVRLPPTVDARIIHAPHAEQTNFEKIVLYRLEHDQWVVVGESRMDERYNGEFLELLEGEYKAAIFGTDDANSASRELQIERKFTITGAEASPILIRID